MAQAHINGYHMEKEWEVMDDSLQHIEPTLTTLTPLTTSLTDYFPLSGSRPEDFPNLPPIQNQCQPHISMYQNIQPVYRHDLELLTHDLHMTKQHSLPLVDSGVSSGSESPASSPRSSPVHKVIHNQDHSQGVRPEESYVYMIGQAILNSPEKCLILGDIYKYILDHYPYYRTVKIAWKNWVRHNLSANECFVRTKNGGGKGFLWAIHEACLHSVQKGVYCRRTLNQMVFNYKKGARAGTLASSMEAVPSVTSTAVRNQSLVAENSTQHTETAAFTTDIQRTRAAYTPMTCTVVQPSAFITNTLKGKMTKKQRYLAAHAQCVQLLGYTLQ